MNIDAWWLLLPLGFFALGWFAARIDIRYVLREARSLPAAYFRGLNHLLRQEQDKAMESFIDVSKRDPHSLDLQLALGSLFRQQGRIDEATRIHQSIYDRHDIPKEKRELAQYELALDFHAAGLFDRAEAVYESLRGTSYEAEAEARLANVLEQEKEWEKAVAARKRVEALTRQPQGKIVANYRCEQAEMALARGDQALVAQLLQAALQENRQSGRVRLIELKAAVKRSDWPAAQEAVAALQRVQPELLLLATEELSSLYRAIERPELLLEQLQNVQIETRSSIGLSRLIDASLEIEGHHAALARLKQALSAQPSAREAARWLELEAETAEAKYARTMQQIAHMIRHATDRTPGFHCRYCGFSAPRYYWKCPGCNQWDQFTATPLS